jgi:glycosyltransferase involved in cell wall biosynthesis
MRRIMAYPIRILELRSVRGTGGGPEKTIVYGARRSDPSRYATTVCYIRDRRDDAFGPSSLAHRVGVDYVEVTERHSFDPSILGALRRLVVARHIQIVHAHDYKTDLVALALSRVAPVRPLATAHGWTGHSARERRFYYPADKRLLAWYPRVVAVSTDIASEIVRHGAAPERITTILNGIDHERFQRDPAREAAARAALSLPADAVVIGAVGRLEPQKRFDVLLRAAVVLRGRVPGLKVVIAGDGGERERLHQLARELDLASTCVFTGHSNDVAGLHHAFDLLVQSSDYEGTPNAVLEAMAFETPIVATDAGGTRELVEDGVHGVVVRPGDPALLARAIESALADRRGLRERATAARRRVERELSFDARMRKLEAVFEELVDVAPVSAVAERSWL